MSRERQEQLLNVKSYLTQCDNEINLLLQNFQWDRKTLMSDVQKTTCSYDTGHRIPAPTKENHEKQCFLKLHGYNEDDLFLPEPLHQNSKKLVKLSNADIQHIIESASKNDPTFKKVNRNSRFVSHTYNGIGLDGPPPLTLERLQWTFSADERRAIHDAVVAADPTGNDLSDLALIDASSVKAEGKPKSRLEILAELRDMKRRRTKYRVAPKTKNYSYVLRDVIKTQMEFFADIHDLRKRKTTEDNGETHASRQEKYYASYETNHNSTYKISHSRERSKQEEGRRRRYEVDDKYKRRNHDRDSQRNDEHRKHRDRSYEKARDYRNHDAECNDKYKERHSDTRRDRGYRDGYDKREGTSRSHDNRHERRYERSGEHTRHRRDERSHRFDEVKVKEEDRGSYDGYYKISREDFSKVRVKREKDETE